MPKDERDSRTGKKNQGDKVGESHGEQKTKEADSNVATAIGR